ncbi:MAG: xylose isomerase [Bauldia sp.]|nr:xylose isomerase [Bauldia sp.]
MSALFGRSEPVVFAGAESRDPFAYRFYDPDRVVLGKRLEDLLRPAVCYWHSFGYDGLDPFGGRTMSLPWAGGTIADFRRKADAVFEFLRLLGVPWFTFHDRDIAPEGASLAEYERNVREMAGYLGEGMARTGKRVLWGTANLFYDRRFMAGAATNPDPDVFAYGATQVKTAIEVTHQLGGENYVVWGGREGYETLLNTDLGRELDQLGRFIALLVEHKHRIGFKGTILIEPKPQEPTKHQYDFDVATVYGFLCRYGLQDEVKVNIEAAHAVLAGHSFEHEIAMATALGVFGSIDINRNDDQSGWDTDQFPTNPAQLVMPFYELLRGGGFTTGGLNFDARIRRQSIDPRDVLLGHIGGLDGCAKAAIAAAAMIEDGALQRFVDERYAGWDSAEARAMLSGKESLEAIAARLGRKPVEPQPRSGQQEYLENLLLRYQ